MQNKKKKEKNDEKHVIYTHKRRNKSIGEKQFRKVL